MCMYGVLCGDVHLHTERHTYTQNVCCHIAIMDQTFSNFKLSDFNEETTSSLRMISIEIETCWRVLSVLSVLILML
jgi:hypothetical protein